MIEVVGWGLSIGWELGLVFYDPIGRDYWLGCSY